MRYTDYKFVVPDEKVVRVIHNTDAKNEADDQFAIVQALLSPKFENVGFIAAHYGDRRHDDSMERSYKEIQNIFDIMGFDHEGQVYKGATKRLPDRNTPIDSEGARLIIKEALADDKRPLYVTFMGPLTDMASAFLLDPSIKDRVKVIWIGGGSYPLGHEEFNMGNDIHAANVVFSSGMEVWQVPKNVYEMIPVSMAELEVRVAPHGKIGRYLFDQLVEHSMEDAPRRSAFRTGESWVLGDSPSVGLILYEYRFEYELIDPPFINEDMTYETQEVNHKIRVYRRYDPRIFLEDLYAKLELFANKH